MNKAGRPTRDKYPTILREIYRTLRHAVRLFRQPAYNLERMDYDQYWREQIKLISKIEERYGPLIKDRFAIIAQHINPSSRVLDVGCGDGSLLSYLKTKRRIIELGIDISQVAVEYAATRGLEVRVQSLDDLANATNLRFDHVIISEVIEHVSNSEEFIHWCWSLTEQSLIITFPNIAYLPHRLRLLFGRFPVQWVHYPSEHLRFWSILDFDYWLRSLNLSEADTKVTVVPTNGIKLGLYKLFPNLFANQIVVIIKRKTTSQ